MSIANVFGKDYTIFVVVDYKNCLTFICCQWDLFHLEDCDFNNQETFSFKCVH